MRLRAQFVLFVGLFGCAGVSDSPGMPDAMSETDAGLDAGSVPVDGAREILRISRAQVRRVPLLDEGVTPVVELHAPSGAESMLLKVDSPGNESDFCLRPEPVWIGEQLHSSERHLQDMRPYCTDCQTRFMAQSGGGAWVLPLHGERRVQLRLSMRHCELHFPMSRGASEHVLLQYAAVRDGPVELTLVPVRRSDASIGSDGDLRALFTATERLLEPAGIMLTWAQSQEHSETGSVLVREVGAEGDFGGAVPSGSIRLVLASSIRVRRAGSPDTTAPAYTTRIPNLGLSDGAIILATGDRWAPLTERGAHELALLLAHEVGHALGLFHADQPEGAHLAGSRGRNIMSSRPWSLTESEQRFTAEQGEVMRIHLRALHHPRSL